MKIPKLISILVVFVLVITLCLARPTDVFAATSPTLSALSSYSVLGGQEVTCTASATTTGAVGVSSGTSITGFSPSCTAGGGTQNNNASAIAAQAENLTTFTTLDQGCDHSYSSGQNLTLISPLVPGVYCSAGSFLLTGNLTLSGSGVWIFKTVSTLITSPGSSVTGGDPCNVWWRIGSSATLDTTTSFIGNIFTHEGVNAMNSGATLNGRILTLDAGTVTLNANTISGPTCAAATPTPTSGSSSSSSNSSSGGSSSGQGTKVCPVLSCVTPIIIEQKRVSPTSIFISWGPYAGINTFIVQYGLENGNWLYNTTVTGFSTTINALPANQPIWVLVSPTDNCSTGRCGVAKFVGSPSLPNTGIGPHDNNILWNMAMPIAIVMLVSVSLVVFLRKRRA